MQLGHHDNPNTTPGQAAQAKGPSASTWRSLGEGGCAPSVSSPRSLCHPPRCRECQYSTVTPRMVLWVACTCALRGAHGCRALSAGERRSEFLEPSDRLQHGPVDHTRLG